MADDDFYYAKNIRAIKPDGKDPVQIELNFRHLKLALSHKMTEDEATTLITKLSTNSIQRRSTASSITLTATSKPYQVVLPTAPTLSIYLPAGQAGLHFAIKNGNAYGGESIVVRDSTGASIRSLAGDQGTDVWHDGTEWQAFP
jgi:hypothetical protein